VSGALGIVDGLAIALVAIALLSVANRGLVLGVWFLVVEACALALVAAALAIASGSPHLWLATGLTIVVRAGIGPAVLFRVIRAVELRYEARPLVSTRTALVAAIGLTLVAFLAAGDLRLTDGVAARQALPASLSLAFIGLLLMTTRRKAVSQLIGFVTLENGIFLAGLIATRGFPLFVEIGVLFDLLFAVAVMAVFTLRINEHFDTVSTDQLRRLRG